MMISGAFLRVGVCSCVGVVGSGRGDTATSNRAGSGSVLGLSLWRCQAHSSKPPGEFPGLYTIHVHREQLQFSAQGVDTPLANLLYAVAVGHDFRRDTSRGYESSIFSGFSRPPSLSRGRTVVLNARLFQLLWGGKHQ